LLDQARAEGVEVRDGEDGFPHSAEGRWTLIATGRHAAPAPRGARAYYGIQAYFDQAAGISDQVELDWVRGGYVGLTRHENGRTNVCALLCPSWIQEEGPDLDHVLSALERENAALSRHLRGASRVSAWQAIGPVVMGIRALAAKNTFYV